MKYEVKHICGHTRTVNLFGPTRDRERKIEWMESIPCPECQKAKQEQQEQERTQEMGLPELDGSEKQVSWATSIRLEKLDILTEKSDYFQAKVDEYTQYLQREGLSEDRIAKAKARLEAANHNMWLVTEIISRLSGITEAHWWIENRDADAGGLANAFKALQDAEKEKAIEEETKPAMVIMEPEERKTSTVATVKAYDKEVLVLSDKDEQIRLTIKRHGFSWDGSRKVWAKPVTEMTGPAKDLAPDTARILLRNGIPVKVRPEIMEAVQSDSFEHETRRWIMRSRKDPGKLFIVKVEGVILPDDCRTTYNGDGGIISPTAWREVREFASLNGYKITRLAEEMLRKAETATVSVKLPSGETVQTTTEDALKAVLNSSRDVLEDLKEED